MNSIKEKSRIKAEISIFLSFIFLFFLSLIMAIAQAATFQISKNYKRGEVELAMQSTFGEYHKGMLEEFDVFTLDGSYETSSYDEENILSRLEYYGVYETDMNVKGLGLLTDNEGALFLDQAIRHMKHKYGIQIIENWTGSKDEWSIQETQGNTIADMEASGKGELESAVEDEKVNIDVEENPLEAVEAAKAKGILALVIKEQGSVSSAVVEKESLPSNRAIRKGQGDIESGKISATEKLLYGEYLIQHFESYRGEESKNSLRYELEYILQGKDSDMENLKSTANQLVLMRIAPNYLCISKSASMQATLSSTALAIATASGAPPLQPMIKQALQFAWVYGESVMDVRSLYSGNHVTLIKKEEDWQLGIAGLFSLGTDLDNNDGKDMEGGLGYDEYLRVLLYLENQDTLTMRSLDLVEERIKNTYGQQNFQVDGCVNYLWIENTARLKGGFTYQFPMSFTYR